MVSAMSCAVVVLMLLGVAHAQVGQGSSAQRNLGAKLGSLCGGARYTATSSVLGVGTLKKGAASGVDYALSDLSVQPCDTRLINVPYAIGLMSVHVKVGATPRPNLRFSACVLDRIYKCLAKTWNDAVLSAVNPSLKTVTGGPKPISRSDVSGTTFTFTNFIGKGCPNWKYGSITIMSNAPALRGCYNTHAKGRGTGGVVTTYAATANGVAYIAAAAITTGTAALKSNVAAPSAYFLPQATNTALLTRVLIPGTPTCGLQFDITAARQNTYPLAYLAFFVAFGARPVRANPASVKTLCKCIINSNAALVAGQADFRAVPANIKAIATARCNLIKP